MQYKQKIVNHHLQIEVIVNGKEWSQHFEEIKISDEEPKMLGEAFESLKTKLLPKLHKLASQNHTTYFENNAYIIKINRQFVKFIVKFKIFPSVSMKIIKNLKLDFRPLKFNYDEVEFELKRILLDATPFTQNKNYRVKNDDYVFVNLRGFLKNKPIPGWNYNKLLICVGKNPFFQAFDQAIINTTAGTYKEIEIEFPSDHPNSLLKAQKAAFEIEILAILDRNLQPQFSNKFVKSLAINNVSNKKELTNYIEFVIKEKNNQMNISKFADIFFAKILSQIDFEIPDHLIDVTAKQIQLKKHLDKFETLFLDRYANHRNPKNQNYDFLAIEKIKREIILEDIARQQKINVGSDEINQTYKMIAMVQNQQLKIIKKNLSKTIVSRFLLNQKVIKKMIEKTL